MEIDLELPSHEQEKLDSGSNASSEVMDVVDELDDAEDEVISPNEHVIGSFGQSTNDNHAGNGVDLDNNTVGADFVGKGPNFEPQNGLMFETKEAAYSFYREYARSVGFGITIKASRRSKKSGKFIDVKIACSRFGSKRESSSTANPRSCTKTDCKAGMHMKRTQEEKWIIHSFIKEHNHEICPDDFPNTIQGRGKQSGAVPCQRSGLQLSLNEEDVQIMLAHFTDMQAKHPNFFYAIDLDHGKRMRSVFWVDAKGRQDYSVFNDVVFFDTFYVKDKYKIPYVPIVGVNHHFQLVLLGNALIEEQTTSNFTWLMRTWLKAVGGQAPRVVVTDQEKFLNEAVAEVFPGTRHCYCLWHILNKIPENLYGVINQNEIFMAKFNKCIYRSWKADQFERRWWKMVDRFGLREDEWVLFLYEHRKKWAPTYMQGTFLAGISTTERSGSIASSFDVYIQKEATLKEFMDRYKIFLQDRHEMEYQADSETQNKQAATRSLSALEKQMSTIYTDAIFKKFQSEVLRAVSCHLQTQSEDGQTLYFQVDDSEERQNYCVSWNKATSDICCLCHSFEYRGFLCKHAIFVLQISGVPNIPSQYILKRWTKYAKINETVAEVSSSLQHRVDRFNDLCKRAMKFGEQGSFSQEAYDIAFHTLNTAFEACVGANNSIRSVLPALPDFHGIEEANCSNNLTKSFKKKTSKKNKVNSIAHPPDSCQVPEHDTQVMDLGLGAPTLDGYYGSQQSLQGQMNSISPVRNGYYGNQPPLPGLGQLGFKAPSMQRCFDIDDSL